MVVNRKDWMMITVLIVAMIACWLTLPRPASAEESKRVIDQIKKSIHFNEDLDITDPAVRDSIREDCSRQTMAAVQNFVKGFSAEEIKKKLKEIPELENQLPPQVIDFITDFRLLEIDDQLEGEDDPNIDKVKVAYVLKKLVEFNHPESFVSDEEAAECRQRKEETMEELQRTLRRRQAEGGGLESKDIPDTYESDYEKTAPRRFYFAMDQGSVITEDPSDYLENLDKVTQIAEQGGLPNQVTSQLWLDLQASGVYQDENGKWQLQPGWFAHTHEMGTIRDYQQENYDAGNLQSGAELVSTELDSFSEDIKMSKFRALVSHGEQKVLYVDYEHAPDGFELNAHEIDRNPFRENGVDPKVVVVDSNHPSGGYETMIIRNVCFRDISIPIMMIDEANDTKVKVEDEILKWEKEVDTWDKPPIPVDYIIPPLLEGPLPPTTFTRDQYPLAPSWGGR